jgi:hypothetical protein
LRLAELRVGLADEERLEAPDQGRVGPLLPELLAMLDPGASVARLAAPPADSVEAKVERALAALAWLPAPKRR